MLSCSAPSCAKKCAVKKIVTHISTCHNLTFFNFESIMAEVSNYCLKSHEAENATKMLGVTIITTNTATTTIAITLVIIALNSMIFSLCSS